MAKKRTINELRQTKDTVYTNPGAKKTWDISKYGGGYTMSKEGKEYLDIPEPKDDIEATKALIVSTIKEDMFDMIFQAVNEEMSKYYVFQQDNYLTEAGEDLFMDQWFEFYHEQHGDILGAIMKGFTN